MRRPQNTKKSPPAIPLQSDVALVAAAAAAIHITYSEASGVSTLFRGYVFGGLQRASTETETRGNPEETSL